MLLLLAQVAAASPAWPPSRAQLVLGTTRSTSLDLWRAYPDADKIYVLAGLPDGSEALFMVDTGASISVIQRDVVERLGLPVEAVDGRIEGLSGSVAWKRAVVPQIHLGDFQLNAVDMAVDVPGVPELAGPLPIAGILGNNVWVNFTCELDYPADLLVLHAPGTWKVHGRSAPLVVDNLHAYTPVTVRAADGTTAGLVLQLDTGAHDVVFRGPTGSPFLAASTRGVEPVLGVGADLDELPIASFLKVTRRVPLARVRAGGRSVPLLSFARWYDPDLPPSASGDLPGLLGYDAMAGHVAILDYPGEKFQIKRSTRVVRHFDAAAQYLERERKRYGDDPKRALVRARLQYAQGDADAARATIAAGLAATPGDPQLLVLLSWIERNAQAWDASNAALDAADPLALAREREWVAYVDSLVLAGEPQRALEEARSAMGNAEPDAPGTDDLLVGLSDALLATGNTSQAAAALVAAGEASAGASAHLLRAARISEAEGDRDAARAALAQLWTLYPLNAAPIWLSATLATPAEAPSIVASLDAGLAQLHPGDEPWDFAGATLLALGETARGHELLDRGYVRDCAPLPESPDRENCDAWYWALGGQRLDEAQKRIDLALAERPWSSAFHDTAATVAFAAGRAEDARVHALAAARLSPGDPYLLWQLDRIDAKIPPR